MSPPPPAAAVRQIHLRAFDPDAMVMALQDGVLEHVQLQPGVFRGRIAHSFSAGCRLDWGRYALAVQARGQLCADMVTIGLALQGQGEWRGRGQRVHTGDIVVFAERAEFAVSLPPQAQWLSMQVPRHRLEATGLPLAPPPGGAPRRWPGRVHAGLQHTLVHLASALAPGATALPGDAAGHSRGLGQAHDELLSTLLGELLQRGGTGARAGRVLDPGERWRLVRRVEDHLATLADPTVRIDALCLAAGTSLSTLERAFREVFGVGPRRYLTMRRLAAARRELLRAAPGTTVTRVAMRWGFLHLGRFAQDYRHQFGEQPSRTLAGARGAPHAHSL
ncbi:MAG: helix-turn-helix transcriptional regulator [Burkholderiales bacterium]|nr:helix-turn-helix transcriptional regulator [Burkholderiales bacterium]